MALARSMPTDTHRRSGAALFLCVLLVICIGLSVAHLLYSAPAAAWRRLLSSGPAGDMQTAILYYSTLPRLVVALLAGACLAIASSVLQVVLRNPIAEPATLGVSGGASLALAATALWAPGLLALMREALGVLGAGAAMLAVVGLAGGRNLSPIRLILGGLIVSLLCGALNALLTLFHHDNLQAIFIWNAGSLVQNDWRTARLLALQAIPICIVFALMARPLTVLRLDDASARSLGLSLAGIRLMAIVGAVLLSAAVTSAVGVIGFVGLAGATAARSLRLRGFTARLAVSALVGSMLLAGVDQGLQLLSGRFGEIPAGGLTALLGAPMLLWLLPRLASTVAAPAAEGDGIGRARHVGWILVVLLLLATMMAWPALSLTDNGYGLHFAFGTEFWSGLPWRWPRTVAALSAGMMLGVAGVYTQRLTGNPLASPEVLGVSSGASLAGLVTLLAVSQPDRIQQMASGAVGAALTTALIFAFARRASLSPERMLLAGVAVCTLFSGLLTFLMATGDPRLRIFIGWMAGSISRVSTGDATVAAMFALLAAVSVMLLRRWLTILPLGTATSTAVGMNGAVSRSLLFITIGILTAIPTMLVGPLSFVGLMAPHIMRMAGVQKPVSQSFAAGLVGGAILLAADMLGRTILFPYEVPAGLLAALIGAPYFLWRMRRTAA